MRVITKLRLKLSLWLAGRLGRAAQPLHYINGRPSDPNRRSGSDGPVRHR